MISNDLQNRIHFGDREAFLAVYKEYGSGVYTAARKALVSDSLAKNAVKQTFLTLHEEILANTEDFDIPVRIREITEHEIRLLRMINNVPGSENVELPFIEKEPDPEQYSARGAFSEDADPALDLPPLERDRSFRKPRKALFIRKPKAKDANQKPRIFRKILLLLIDLFLLWILLGILMAFGYLPAIDLGYSWLSHVLSSF